MKENPLMLLLLIVEGCAYNDLDFSPAAFDKLADESLGRIDITWEWLN